MMKYRSKKGITLVALVVTIIILLVLAGITIALLTGDNGLIGKTGEAKNATEESAIKENLEINVLASYKKRSIDYNLLNNKLSNINGLKYKNNSISDSNKITKLPDWVDIKGYKFDILEDGTIEKRPDFETLESLYGTVLNGYNGYEATDVTEWKLLYVDEENREAFIISSNIISPQVLKNSGIPLISSNGVSYTGSNNVKNTEYGKKYNKLWLEKCSSENTNESAKATAYMCDPDNWKQYKTAKAKYAAGGATLEILISSFYDKQLKDIRKLEYNGEGSNIKDTNSSGYSVVGLNNIETNNKNNLYDIKQFYLLASPSRVWVSNILSVYNSISYAGYGYIKTCRPVVCLPISTIEISGEGENITLNYK